MTNTPSTPDISVGELASELGTSISDVQTRARNLAPWMAGPVYVGGRVSGHAADAVRRTYLSDQDAAKQQPQDVTVSALATELSTTVRGITQAADLMRAQTGRDPYTDRTAWYAGDRVLDGGAADAIRREQRPADSGPTLAGLARELDVSMSTAAALVTVAGEPLHQVWYGGEVIAPDVADLARRQYRERVPTLDPADVERARIVALLRTHPWGPTFDLDTIGSVADFIEGDDRG
jgi:hypothetical protein